MLKKYKNQYVEFIKDLNFGSKDYEIKYYNNSHDTSQTSIDIIFKNTPFSFNIKSVESDWHSFYVEFTDFAPGYPIVTHPTIRYINFQECLDVLKNWVEEPLKEYFEEINRPDLLEMYALTKDNSISNINFEINEKFTKNEKELLRTGLEEIKLLIREEFSFTSAQINLIDNRIDYLEDAADRIGKTDFKGILISTILSIITSLALQPENSRKLFSLFSKLIENIPQLNW